MSKKGPKKKKNKAHRSMNASSLAQRILRLLQKRPFTQFPLADLALEMGMYERTGKILIKAALDILKSSEKIKEVNP